LTARLRALLTHRRAPLILAVLALLLTLPALGGGFVMDDYFHRNVLLRRGEWSAARPLWDLFAFVPADPAAWMRNSGLPPWWSSPGVLIHFARPLTALTHMLDYALWPDSAVLQHLHSLFWYALAVGLAAALYRRLFDSPIVAGAAGLLFAVADSHAMAVGWLSGRNGLLCLVCGLGALHLHLSWRRTGSVRFLASALLLFALGLGCGEAALGTLAYIAAWHLVLEEGSWQKRILPLAPYAGLVVLWRILYISAGFGTRGSPLYVDPGSQPRLFLQAFVERAPLLTASQWLKVPIDVLVILPRQAQLTASILAALLAAGMLALLWRPLRREAMARFWALGMAFSLVPICAAFPMDRLLLFAGLGGFGLMAVFFECTGLWPLDRARDSVWRRRAAWVLLILHGPVAAVLFPVRTLAQPLSDPSPVLARLAPREPEVAGQTFIFVNGHDMVVAYVRLLRVAIGDAPAPKQVAVLASFTTRQTVRRTDDRALEIRADGGFIASTIDRLLADPGRRFFPGERIERPSFTAQIRSLTADGRPLEVAFHFHTALEDPGLRWLYWKDGRLQEFPLPAVGETVTVPAGL
jgi:hypothetical protein